MDEIKINNTKMIFILVFGLFRTHLGNTLLTLLRIYFTVFLHESTFAEKLLNRFNFRLQ